MKRKKYESHGMSNTSFYSRWKGMMRRCYNPNFSQYHDYGGRGIKVCKRWHSFLNFKEDMLDSFAENLELDRIDNNGDYSKNNCRWVTHKVNSSNIRRARLYKGENACDASIRLGGHISLVSGRLYKGWSLEKAFTTPYNKSFARDMKPK